LSNEILTYVLSLSTYLAKAYNGCGIAYAELRKYEKAIENFEEAINPHSAYFDMNHC